ncbi:hypothetical protein TorRG33x02_104680, partial [Trema orientale]
RQLLLLHRRWSTASLVKLLTKEDVDHRTLLFDSRATNFLLRMGSPAMLQVHLVIEPADNQGVARVGVEYLSEGAFLRKSKWLPLKRAYKVKVMLEMKFIFDSGVMFQMDVYHFHKGHRSRIATRL